MVVASMLTLDIFQSDLQHYTVPIFSPGPPPFLLCLSSTAALTLAFLLLLLFSPLGLIYQEIFNPFSIKQNTEDLRLYSVGSQ